MLSKTNKLMHIFWSLPPIQLARAPSRCAWVYVYQCQTKRKSNNGYFSTLWSIGNRKMPFVVPPGRANLDIQFVTWKVQKRPLVLGQTHFRKVSLRTSEEMYKKINNDYTKKISSNVWLFQMPLEYLQRTKRIIIIPHIKISNVMHT